MRETCCRRICAGVNGNRTQRSFENSRVWSSDQRERGFSACE